LIIYKVVIDDVREVFVTSYVWPAVACGLLYEGRYLLGTAIARPCISQGLIKAAKAEGASIIAHGATGKGNDQVRFELNCYSLYPEITVLHIYFINDYFTSNRTKISERLKNKRKRNLSFRLFLILAKTLLVLLFY